MGRIHRRGHGARIRVEGESPLPQEGDAESEEEDTADSTGREGLVPTADDYLGHAGHVGGGRSGQEPHEHRLVQGDAGQDQQRYGGQKRSDGYPAAVTHVAHVTNHP
ncbi:MAG: hypothetical protein JWM01_2043 [Arthrobacter sp.]|jgi:hypothetical protein|nr:hypothetical protein [Arthrobacter sp.]